MQNLFDHRLQNKDIFNSVGESIKNIFPIEKDGKSLNIKNVYIEDNLAETDFPAQRETKLNRKS